MEINDITGEIVRASMRVHSALGPGLLEGTYRVCVRHELASRGLSVEQERALPVPYRDVRIETGYRVDLLVEDAVIIELKSVARLLPLHQAQLLGYLTLSRRKVGLLINFNVVHVRQGIKRMIL
jgi:GxxExxY protein